MQVVKSIVFGVALFALSHVATALDVASGKIFRIEVGEGDLRILLEGTPVLCGNSTNWAYASRFKPNYDSYLSMLIAAKMAGKSVTIYSAADANGLCELQIVYLQ